jgi:hypothetical protein
MEEEYATISSRWCFGHHFKPTGTDEFCSQWPRI